MSGFFKKMGDKCIHCFLTYKGKLAEVFAVVGLCCFFGLVGIGCPIKFMTGISCAGCGMTRAWISVLQLDLKNAFFYNPAFPVPLIAVVMFLLREKMNRRLYQGIVVVLIAILILVYIYRMFFTVNDIVVCKVSEGFIYRIIISVKELLVDTVTFMQL